MTRRFRLDRGVKGADTLAAVSSMASASRDAASYPGDAKGSGRLRLPGMTSNAVLGSVLAAGFALVAFLTAGGTDLGPNTWVEIALALVVA